MSDVTLSDCASQLQVLSEQSRLEVVRLLLGGPSHVKALQEAIGIEQSLLSHHLRVLRDAGVVESERDGKSVLYRLSPDLESRRRGHVIDFGCCRLTFDD
ncbi:MAG: metalloregulator ArsR/SmtB family transcription factor [Planctomycetota bacterium]